jgi:hypothetical protein
MLGEKGGGAGEEGEQRKHSDSRKRGLTELFTNNDTLSRRQLVFGYQSVAICFFFLLNPD